MFGLKEKLLCGFMFLIFIVLSIAVPVLATDIPLENLSLEFQKILNNEATKGVYVNIDTLNNISHMNKSRFNETIEQTLFDNADNKSSFEVDAFLIYEQGNLTFFMNTSSQLVNEFNDTFLLDVDIIVKNNLNSSYDFRINRDLIDAIFQNISKDVINYSACLSVNDSDECISKRNNITVTLAPNVVYSFRLTLYLKPVIGNFNCKSITLRDLLPKDLVILDSDIALDTVVRRECTFNVNAGYLEYVPFVKVNVSDLSDNTINALVSLNDYVSSFEDEVITFALKN